MSNSTVLTKEALQKLQDELYYLKSVKRNEISEKIKVAREFGDLSENAEYDAARDAQREMEERILYLEEQIKNATVLEKQDLKDDKVTIGTRVTVYDEEMEEEFQYEIVSKTEADPEKNRVSDQSPIGIALLGGIVGEVCEVEAPNGSYNLKIVRIELAVD